MAFNRFANQASTLTRFLFLVKCDGNFEVIPENSITTITEMNKQKPLESPPKQMVNWISRSVNVIHELDLQRKLGQTTIARGVF